ncbi:hypothetical protein [Marimonas arenosa]|uniref:Uncharacterized protein n=1 Tax=Marimonas arenosa TaxID=1795305 RepID=A0AAE4B6R2_9RHOB|nr:hypothetical protein [Marimonas arenosa]MDQ2092362.1 hypothetical protein [Marimonas arenosa]
MDKEKRTTRISTSEDVAALELDLRSFKRRRVGRLQLDIPGMDDSTQNRLSLALNRNYAVCGCGEATALGLVGLVVGAGYAWAAGLIPDAWLAALGYTLGGFTLGVATGKLIGKSIARARLSRAVEELRQHFGPEELPPEKPTARCAVHGT